MMTPGTPSHEYWTAYAKILEAKSQIENDVIYVENWSNIRDVLSPLITGDNNSLNNIKGMKDSVIAAKKQNDFSHTVTDVVFTAGLTTVSVPIAKLGISLASKTAPNNTGVKFGYEAAKHMEESWRYVPLTILESAIKYGTAKPDPQGSRAIMYYIEMFKNNTPYTLEVLYDKITNTIWHFLYK